MVQVEQKKGEIAALETKNEMVLKYVTSSQEDLSRLNGELDRKRKEISSLDQQIIDSTSRLNELKQSIKEKSEEK